MESINGETNGAGLYSNLHEKAGADEEHGDGARLVEPGRPRVVLLRRAAPAILRDDGGRPHLVVAVPRPLPGRLHHACPAQRRRWTQGNGGTDGAANRWRRQRRLRSQEGTRRQAGRRQFPDI